MFSNLVVGYLFLGGAGAGFLVLLCILEFANTSRSFLSRLAFPLDFFERAWPLCTAVLITSMAFLVADLGVSERAFMVLTIPTLTPLTIGAYALSIACVVALVFSILAHTSQNYATTIPAQKLTGIPRMQARTRRLIWGMYMLEAGGILAGMVVVLYTGIMLADMPSVLAWATPLVPILFVLSSFSCGIALVFIAAAFTESRQTFFQSLRRFTNFDTVLIALETLCLLAYVVWCFMGSATHDAAYVLIQGELAPWVWGALVACGLCAPVFLERLITRQDYRTQLLWVAGGILVGGFALRFCVVGLAAFDPSMVYNVTLAAA